MDVEAALNSGDCTKDVPLEWGDVIEIPEKEHLLDERWWGLTHEVVQSLVKCVQRKVRVSSRGETVEFASIPQIPSAPYSPPPNAPFVSSPNAPFVSSPSQRPPSADSTGTKVLQRETSTFSLYTLVQQSGILRTSSDLTRVKVRRKESAGQPGFEAVYNVLNSPGNDDLWLRDGDEIEIPEKP